MARVLTFGFAATALLACGSRTGLELAGGRAVEAAAPGLDAAAPDSAGIIDVLAPDVPSLPEAGVPVDLTCPNAPGVQAIGADGTLYTIDVAGTVTALR